LIVHSASDVGKDEQEVVVLLHDFSFTPAEELLARLTKGRGKSGMSMSGMGMDGMAEMMSGMGHDELMKHMTQMRGTMPGMRPGEMTGAWISTTSTTTRISLMTGRLMIPK
jgi:hypothetical protein